MPEEAQAAVRPCHLLGADCMIRLPEQLSFSAAHYPNKSSQMLLYTLFMHVRSGMPSIPNITSGGNCFTPHMMRAIHAIGSIRFNLHMQADTCRGQRCGICLVSPYLVRRQGQNERQALPGGLPLSQPALLLALHPGQLCICTIDEEVLSCLVS